MVYAPTEDTDVTIKDNFYADLQAVTDDVPRHDLGIVLGDFNAKVGCDNSNWSRVMGTHGLGVMNEIGSRLVEYCAENDMIIGGTLFQHKSIHKYTWTSPGGNTRNQIDHIMIYGKWTRSLLDVRSFRGADLGSDHELVVAKIQLKLAAQRKMKKPPKLSTSDLLDSSLRDKYQVKIAERYDVLPQLPPEPDVDFE